MQTSRYQTIHLHPHAPSKPALGVECNGCGVCCASAPCPIGMLISRRLRGPCKALIWQDAPPRYVCGVLAQPQRFSRLRWEWANRWLRAFAARAIGQGVGCDAGVEVMK